MTTTARVVTTTGKIWLDVISDCFFDDFVPGKSRDESAKGT